MLPKPIIGSAATANTLSKSAKDNKKGSAQVESGLAHFVSLPTTADTLIQSRSPLDTLHSELAYDLPGEFTEKPVNIPEALSGVQSAELFQNLVGEISAHSQRVDLALETGAPAVNTSAESNLLDRLVVAIEDARDGSARVLQGVQ